MDTTDSAYGDKLIRLDTFDTAVAVDPSAEDEAKRRFMTLILQTAHRNNGNIGHVLRATNTSGEVFAVKLLKDNAILSGQAPDRSAEQSAAHLANTAALFEEYRHLCTVSYLRGFPRVYGYGSCEDDPLILMEWVEGTSLKQALPPASARRLGRADHPDGRRRRKRRASCALDDPRPRESGRPSRPVACQYHVPHHQPNTRAADCRLFL